MKNRKLAQRKIMAIMISVMLIIGYMPVSGFATDNLDGISNEVADVITNEAESTEENISTKNRCMETTSKW